ncbi:hypothetical protein F4V43_19255 [Paenibacillus spiritus]|uniref:Uncharacterized protein n=1 Tax=Paenibacillus spiritus TaxID=2496557 RepID=A0A5J5FT34_9BACL|nr:hypothetical protein [Paenibacillus spiritus]KAA8995652.1 hypothetical protein F4V43_19255 [Paenibacillus spiritus]
MISGTNGVAGALQVLNSALTLEEDEAAEQVTALAVAKDWGALGPATDRAKQLESFRKRVETLIKDWQRSQSSSGSASSAELQAIRHDISVPVEERSTWGFVGRNVRVETDGSTKYSNLIPRNLLFSLMMEAYKLIKLNGFVKTSQVLPGTEEMIREMSDYKSESTNRLPIYVAFKVLLIDGILIKNSHKYSFAPGGEDKFFDLLALIDGKDEDKKEFVPHEEAVRRLREAGETEMADDLDAYANKTSQKGGWDGAVTGEQGDLYKRHGKRMREIIWPYRYR